MPPRLPLPCLAVLLALSACGDEAEWPALLPTDALLEEPAALATRPEVRSSAAATDPLVARANALQARAEALRRRPVIEPATLARMRAAGA